MYEAFDAHCSSARRIALAKEALQIFPDCADAYVLLAEDTGARKGTKILQAGS